MKKANWSALILTLLSFAGMSFAQVAPGTPPFASLGGGPSDVINLGNLNAHLTVPIRHKPGRGMDFNYDLTYDSSIWYPAGSSGSQNWIQTSSTGLPGWNGLSGAGKAYIGYTMVTQDLNQTCKYGYQGSSIGTFSLWAFSNFYYVDEFGTRHTFQNIGWAYATNTASGFCGPNAGFNPSSANQQSLANDDSGYTIVVTPGSSGASAYIRDKNNKTINPPIIANSTWGTQSTTDRNGNQITVSTSGVYTDTLGQQALTVTGTAPSNTNLSYTAPSGGTASYVVKYAQYTVQTNFQCSGVSQYGPLSQYLISEIDLPDISQNPGSKYTFTYEATPGNSQNITGRIASVTLPTGGSITYQYNNGGLSSSQASNGIVCVDGSTAGLKRTLSNGDVWQYSRSLSGSTWTTTVTDPAGNQTVINFAEDSNSSLPTYNFYETQRNVYQGASTLLQTTTTCYNGNYASCGAAAVSSPITQTDTYRQLAGGQIALSEVKFDAYGTATDDKEYGYGVSMGSAPSSSYLLRDTQSPTQLFGGYYDAYLSVKVLDGAGNTLANTTYNYDQSAPTATSGTPQHASGINSGNVTTVTTQVSGTASLIKQFNYYDTGLVRQAIDVNNATTTYTYGACGNSFPTLISEPLGLSRSMSYDTSCKGGVVTSLIDERGKTTSTSYTDAYYWRPASQTDPLSNITQTAYSPTSTETSLNFNGTSTSDVLAIVDAFGRPVFSQQRQAQGSSTYDSVQTAYGWTTTTGSVAGGALTTTSVPYPGSSGQSAPSGTAVTTTQYDALGRTLKITDGGTGYTKFTYSSYDVLQETGPAATGEHVKQKQLEYDALGRLTSVCEITSLSGSGACSQSNSVTGYWTKYTYDFYSGYNRTTVTQNAQSSTTQTRTYLYDLAGRLVSEANPESGTTTYAFDSSSSCSGTPYTGDLVRRTDARGNSACYAYDSLRRVTSIIYGGPDAANTPNKYFVYDAATVNSLAMSNAAGQMAEAYTGSASSKITDLGFSYSARGELTDVYQSTLHSGGYYRVSAGYFANGALQGLTSNITGLPNQTYNVDGEGRLSTVSAISGQNPVTATVYNLSAHTTTVTYGSIDQDVFTFDPNTGRMTQYNFSVGGKNVTGMLNWNANGSLGSLAINDAWNASDAQTCSYTHDDLARIASVNCGYSLWAQNFGYDAFGNITKTVPTGATGQAFSPGYSSTTNQFTSLSGLAYDANGRLTNDSVHMYSWDAEGKMLSLDSTTLTHDALGRMVEKNVSGAYTQFVYSPLGSKFATMNGQALVKAFIPLPAGGTAVYTSTGLTYYRHPDHLGSSRLASTTSGTASAGGGSVTVGGNEQSAPGSGTATLAIDAQVSQDSSSASTTITTPSFSTTSSNELLLAFIASDGNGSPNTTVTGIGGAGLTWQLVKRTNTQLGTAEVWRAFASSTLSNVTVTATLSQSVAASITVVSFSGVDTTGTNGSGAIGATAGANAGSGAPTASLVTTRSGSWVFGVGNDWDNATSRTLGPNQTMVHQYLASVGDTYWVQRSTSTTPNSGTTVTINDTAPTGDRYNLSIVEILPAVTGGGTIYDTGTVSITVNGQQATASYGQGDTAATVTSKIISAVNSSSLPVTAKLSGTTTVILTANQTGANTNYSLSASSSTSQPGTFSQASFTMTPSGGTLIGGSNSTPTMYASVAYAPFGEPYSPAGNSDLSFTGQDQDTAPGTYDFLARRMNSASGRWLSPDPAGLGAVDPTNPQSWNRYAYLNNSPLTTVDPLGLDGCPTATPGGDDVRGDVPCYYQASYGGPPPSAAPACTTSYCPGASGGAVWNETTPNELQSGYNQYAQQQTASFSKNLNTPPSNGNWIPAGGDYQGSGCLRAVGTDNVWCPSSVPAPSDDPSFAGNPLPPNDPTSIFNKWATRGKPPTNAPRVRNPIWPNEPAPVVDPPVEAPKVPLWKLLPLKFLEWMNGMEGGSYIFVINPCLTAPSARCGPYAPPPPA